MRSLGVVLEVSGVILGGKGGIWDDFGCHLGSLWEDLGGLGDDLRRSWRSFGRLGDSFLDPGVAFCRSQTKNHDFH